MSRLRGITLTGGHTNEGGCARAEAGEGEQAVAHLLHTHEHISVRVEEGRQHAQAVPPQHLHIHRHALRVALHRPHLQPGTHNSQICSLSRGDAEPLHCCVLIYMGGTWRMQYKIDGQVRLEPMTFT